jgi:glutaminase
MPADGFDLIIAVLPVNKRALMHNHPEIDATAGLSYESTGHLPTPERVEELMAEAYERYKDNADGRNSQLFSALARVPSEL